MSSTQSIEQYPDDTKEEGKWYRDGKVIYSLRRHEGTIHFTDRVAARIAFHPTVKQGEREAIMDSILLALVANVKP